MSAVVTLKKGEGRMVKSGGMWIFDNEIESVMGTFENGDLVLVHDFDGYPMGIGFINRNSKIRVRLFSRKEDTVIDEAFFRTRLQQAWEYRKKTVDTSSCRVVFGEADFLPGLVIDKFSDVLVVQSLALGIDRYKELIVKLLKEILAEDGITIRGVYERSDAKVRKQEGMELKKGFIGEAFDTNVEIVENGVHYIDSLHDAVESQGDEKGNKSDEIYISIPDDKWDEFADEFSVQVYNNKADYKRNSLIITVLLALLGGVATYFISGHALRPIREFSDKIEEVQAQNLSDSRIEENNVKELNQLGISYNKMLERLSEAFEIQRQFTANAAHELRTPLALMQVQLDLYNSASHLGNDADTLQTIKMVTEQNDKLNRMVKTLLDMSELQSVGRDDKIILDAIVEEVLADIEPLAVEKNIKLIGKCEDATMIGSDILIYRLVYNLVENAIKYNHPLGQVTVTAYQRNKHVYLSVEDTGSGIPKELRERVFEPFFRVDKSRSRELGGVGLGLALVREIVRVHDGSICIKSGKTGGTIFEVTFARSSM